MVRKYSTEEIKNIIRLEAARQGVPVDLALAVAQQESGFNNLSTNMNDDGSVDRGVMQLNSKYHKLKNWQDPMENISYGIRHLKGLLAGAKGDIRKALSDYNAGANATGKGRKQGDSYAQKVMALMNKGNNGKITGAAAPISSDNNSVADNMRDIYEGHINDAQRIYEMYIRNKKYDDTFFKKIKKEADEDIKEAAKKLEKLETTASAEKIKEMTEKMEAAKARYDNDMAIAMDAAEKGIPSDKVEKYVNMFKTTTEDNIKRLQEANPYTRMQQLTNPNPIDLDLQNKRYQVQDAMNVMGASLGLNTPAPDYAALEQQRALQNRAAQIYNATGLTPEEFLQGQTMNYNAMGTALNNQQQLEANLFNSALAGDINAYNKYIQLRGQRGADELAYAKNQIIMQQNEDVNQLARAQLKSQNTQNILNAKTKLYPYAINAEATMQAGGLNQAGATMRQGMQEGTQAANNYLNYEAMLRKIDNQNQADTAEGVTPKEYIEYQKPILNALGYSTNPQAIQQGIANYNAGFYANFPQYRNMIDPSGGLASQLGIQPQPMNNMSSWTNQSVSQMNRNQQ